MRWAIVLALLAGVVGFTPAAVASVEPPSVNLTIAPGRSATAPLSVHVPQKLPRADVLLSFDTTGDMSGMLTNAKANWATLATSLAGLIDSPRYGVVDFKDYYVPASASYGGTGDYPYLAHAPTIGSTDVFTANTSATQTVLNSLSASGGGDDPESYTRPLFESYSDPNVDWRADTRRIMVDVGTSVPHDDDINAGVPGTSGTMSTQVDPGRDGDPATTGDNLDLQTVLSSMHDQAITLYQVTPDNPLNAPDPRPYWDNWTGITGGKRISQVQQNGSVEPVQSSGTNTAEAIRTAVADSASRLQQLALVPGAGHSRWLTVPASATAITAPTDVPFRVKVAVPAGTPAGNYTLSLNAIGDGMPYGTAVVHVRVPALAIRSARFSSSSFKAKKGTKLKLSLSEPATVRLVVTKRVKGRRVAGRCRPKAKKGKKCSLAVQKAKLSFSGATGPNAFTFRPAKLKPGSYSATITARDAAGRISKPVTLKFKIE